MTKTDVLKQYFGHSTFRSGQEELIDHVLSGGDCLGVMPTGAGKSMCYQIPALMMDGTTIVISPLISLMKDQVESLVQSGVSAAYINSTLSPHEYYAVLRGASQGEYRILYVAPERLTAEDFVALCRSIKIPLVAVDEAHCVSHWGQDFRPSYLKINEFVSLLPKRPVLAAFTATATAVVKDDIVNILGLAEPLRKTTGFDRANLYFEVRQVPLVQKDAELLDIIRRSGERSAVVYCSTRKNVEAVSAFLKLNGCKAARYHAGLPDEERRKAQDDFIYDRVNIIVATNAFGMGIDKSDVSLVVHYNMPKDVESYYQEAGRAGRDGSPARCILLYSKADVRMNNFLIDHGHEDSELSEREIELIRERDRERLRQMTFYSTTKRCLREFILRYFGERSPDFCGNCSSCNASFDTEDITVAAQKLISCIFRMKQRNITGGRELVSDILRAKRTEAIISMGLESLSTYGIMRENNAESIEELILYLCAEGYLDETDGTLAITETAEEFIHTRRTLLMKRPKREKSMEEVAAVADSVQENPELMKRFRELRKKIAATLGVPAYVVFTDASLREMSIKEPTTTQEFMNISGVGSRKAERYGKQFARIILDYRKERT
ncbi:MAG: DNA helicase RecQ [Oscillospiraceae bacterium]|nr:DNA helicase RecQ [Oscillospiraceae bacterium]